MYIRSTSVIVTFEYPYRLWCQQDRRYRQLEKKIENGGEVAYGPVPHLVVTVRYGDDVHDEWLLVQLVRELTAEQDVAALVTRRWPETRIFSAKRLACTLSRLASRSRGVGPRWRDPPDRERAGAPVLAHPGERAEPLLALPRSLPRSISARHTGMHTCFHRSRFLRSQDKTPN